MSKRVFREVADVVMHQFADGSIDRHEGQETLDALAYALSAEGWDRGEMEEMIREYAGWPFIVASLRSGMA